MTEDINNTSLDYIPELIQRLETRTETQEVLIHSLLSSYIEMWALINVVVKEIVSHKDTDEEAAFSKQFEETKIAIWGEMGKIAKHDFSGMDEETATAVKAYIQAQQGTH